MDTRQLQTFVTLAGTLNYQRAAAQLQYAPSSLFKHIQLLEEELGAALFFKNGRQLELTREGKRFLPDAQRMLDEWEDVLRAAREQEDSRALSIGGCELNTSYSQRELLRQFIAAYPDARFTMTTFPNAETPEFLLNGQADLGFYYSVSPKRPKGLQSITLYNEPVFPSVAAGHPLLAKSEVTWEDLAACPVVHTHESCVFFNGYLQRLKTRGLAPARVSLLGNVALVAKQAKADGSIILVSFQSQKCMQDEYDIYPLRLAGEPLRFWESVLYRKDAADNPALRRMVRFAVHYADAQILSHPEALLRPPEWADEIAGFAE